MRVALFTPFSPEIGGGSAQLRSHLRYLSGLDVRWHYLSDQPATNPQPQWNWLGSRLTPAELLSDLSARTGILPGSKGGIRKIVGQMDAEMYWVVGHYEGISVAADLCDQQKPVHLTIHDDPFGTWSRSNRFRMFQPLLSRTFPRLLRRAASVDTTSWGMRNLYRQKYDVKCFSVYLHVPCLPQLDSAPDPGKLTVGHIGTLYQKEPFRRSPDRASTRPTSASTIDFAPFDNETVRRAIAMGIDRAAIVDASFPAGTQLATHFLPCAIPAGCGGDPWPEMDPEAARDLLANVGFNDGFTSTISFPQEPRDSSRIRTRRRWRYRPN